MSPLIAQFLDKVKDVEARPFCSLPNAYIEEFFDQHWLQVDHDRLDKVLTHREFYNKTDRAEKYGTIFGVTYVEDQPVMMYMRCGKWLDTYCFYFVSDAHREVLRMCIESCLTHPIDPEFKTQFITDKLLAEFEIVPMLDQKMPIIDLSDRY